MNIAVLFNSLLQWKFVMPLIFIACYIAFMIYSKLFLLTQLERIFGKDSKIATVIQLGILPLQVWLTYTISTMLLGLLPLESLVSKILIIDAIAIKISIIWWAWRLVSYFEKDWHAATTKKLESFSWLDKTSTSAITKLLKGILIVILFLTAINQFGFDLSGLLAVGGIGGIIIGLAAQEVLSNFLSSIILNLEKPFKVGDFITSPDREIAGTVKEIGWRRTRIVTLQQRDILVPNHVFNGIAIENFDTLVNRRIDCVVGLRYQDSALVAGIVEDIASMINNHNDLDKGQSNVIAFDNFGASSLDIKIIFYTITTGFVAMHTIKQNILLRIIDIVHKHGADFAFPTRTLFHENASPQNTAS